MALVIFPAVLQTANAQPVPKIQIALLLDTSNSMDGLIDQTKAQLWKIVNEMGLAQYDGKQPDLEIALYEYGNDDLSADEGHIRMVSKMTTDLDKISEDLFSLKTNGGEEYCGMVIGKAIRQLKWGESEEDLKMIFIAGNEAFTQGDVDFAGQCKQSLGKGIIVNTIFCGSREEGIDTKWKEGAKIGSGQFMNIDHNQKTAYIESPYDDEIINLNKELNETYVAFGAGGDMMKTRQSAQDRNAGSYSKVNMVNRSVSKSSKNYKNSHWDLVEAVDKEEVNVADIDEDDLPEEFKNKDEKEIKAVLEGKKKERVKIRKQINDLNKKRKKYVAKKSKENAAENTLDAAMLKAIRDYARSRDYTFKK